MSISVLNTDAGLSGKTLLTAETAQTVTAAKTFDLDPNPPFVVTSGSAVVPNLDADKVDGVHVSGLAQLGTANAGNLIFTDATYDIGASGATRPRDLFLSRNATIGGTITPTGGFVLATSSYTPTWSGTLGNGTITGKYLQIGKLVHFEVLLTWGSTSSHGATAQTLSLPVTAAAAGLACGDAILQDSGTGQYTALGWLTSTTAVLFYNCDGLQSGAIINTTPFVWTTNDAIQFHGSYFAA